MTDPRSENENRVSLQPAFVLHTYPWRETSLIVEFLTRDYGRLSLVARGAKRPMSQYRGMLSPFCPLAISYAGKGEVKNLFKCEWQGTVLLPDAVLMSAFYMNEILVRLLPKFDPCPRLFTSYFETLKLLSDNGNPNVALRYFELDLLDALGYGLPDTNPECRYYFIRGDWIEVTDPDQNSGISAQMLESMKHREIHPGAEEKIVKHLMRDVIGYYLEERPINTRQILTELKKL